jgi:tetratricopeptide (TPR) repeat protein
MTNRLRGIHPRLVPRAPDPRPSLALLPALRDAGDDVAWAVWYAVWRVRGEDEAATPGPGEGLDRFRDAIGRVPQLDDALRAIAEYLHGIGARRAAADALLRISDWALERGATEPAIQCAEAAAALVPESGRLALAAASANRIFDEAARASLYYERAMTLARFRRKWRTYVRAHLGLGKVKKSLGDPAGARAHYFTAARAARSLSGEKWLAAQTRHDLLVLAAEGGDLEEALQYAKEAVEGYPRHHASLPALAHDVAFLLVRLREYARAVTLLHATVPKLAAREQVIALSTLARAAAFAGDYDGYRTAAESTLRLVGLFDFYGAAAFANLACGAHRLELWADAEQYALRSLEISEKGGHAEAIDVARPVLLDVRAKLRAAADVPINSHYVGRIQPLLAELTARLAAWRGQTWKRKQQAGRDRLGRV